MKITVEMSAVPEGLGRVLIATFRITAHDYDTQPYWARERVKEAFHPDSRWALSSRLEALADYCRLVEEDRT